MSDNIQILRFTTAGSVDDGKSTLIGRLLHDSKSIFEDQWEALERSADLTGGQEVNLANLTDGLRSEREQGITIDVAYRYFATPKRKFIIADTPGHIQYTRNMVTGASTANLALILVDARHGVIEQTRRHTYVASLLGIPHVMVCVNKMDLVDYDEEVFRSIREEFLEFAPQLQIRDISFIPISALKGDNVVDYSKNMDWYHGPTLLGHLEDVYIASDYNLKDFRFPVQWVNRPLTEEHHDFRGYSGQISGGIVRKGDEVTVLPSGRRSKVKQIFELDNPDLDVAFCPMGTTITLEDDIDVSRGDVLCNPDNLPYVGKELDADICWMHEDSLQLRKKYILKHSTNSVRAMVKEISYKVDVETFDQQQGTQTLELNDIGRIQFVTTQPLIYDAYKKNRQMGGFILIDEATHATVAAGMLRSPLKAPPPPEPDPSDYII